MMKTCSQYQLSGTIMLIISFFIIMLFMPAVHSHSPLKVGFYKWSCPAAESIVRRTVRKAVSHNPDIGAGIIRMHFHDCFVRGCDGSVLLKSLPGDPQTERDHPANNGLRGFQVIEEAKAKIESLCPKTVSCADILAFAARDSTYKLGRLNYNVPAGRRDGRVSIFDEVTENLPPSSFVADQLIENFRGKGLSTDEMVTLSGAHSIGGSRCSLFSERLYSFNRTHAQDPSLDRTFAENLKATCPQNGGSDDDDEGRLDPIVALDSATPTRLDNKYYVELRAGRGLLTSDQTLAESPLTRKYVKVNARYGATWSAKYVKAMVKMGSIDVVTGGHQGEIRRRCSFVN